MTKQERLERLRKLRIDRKPGAVFKSHFECLEWIDKVAPLLQYHQRHYNLFQHSAHFARIRQLSVAGMMPHLEAMISTVNQAISPLS